MPTLQRSEAMEAMHFEQIVRPVLNDRRTDWNADTSVSLGYPFKVIREEVIQKGLADFSVGHEHKKYGSLTADEKVLLYCFANMTLHFFEAAATFRGYKATLAPILETPGRKLLVDLGCGPGTAALALIDTFDLRRLSYVGIDRAKPMLRRASALFEAAQRASILAPQSRIATTSSWKALRSLPSTFEHPVRVLMNATYLFASDSLEVDDVCSVVTGLKENENVRRLVFTYSNSGTSIAGAKFEIFKKRLKGMFTSEGPVNDKVVYRKKRSSDATVTAPFVRELLDFKR